MVELIFIHLPKTGGSSILQTLISIYGEEGVRHFERDECLDLNKEGRRIIDVLNPQVKVIHGHFFFDEVNDIAARDGSKLITFMRNPNDRVVSNFYWWKRTLDENPDHPAKDRMEESLKVYAARPETRNKMARFLRGADIDQFFFIGFLERFNSDLNALSRSLGWPETPVFHEKNLSKTKGASKENMSWRIRKMIEKYNREDWMIYRKALEKYQPVLSR